MNRKEFFKIELFGCLKEHGINFIMESVYEAIEKCSRDNEKFLKEFDWKQLEKDLEIKIDPFADELKKQIPITSIAKKFGIKVNKRGMAICPFHTDKAPSLSLNDYLGVFNCFGCGAKGDLIKFYMRLSNEKGRR